MSIEDVDTTDCYIDYSYLPYFHPLENERKFHEVIFYNGKQNLYSFSKKVSLNNNLSPFEQRTQRVHEIALKPLDNGGSVSASATYKWGGKEGGEFSGWAKAEAYKDGSKVEVKIEQKGDGTGSATVSDSKEFKETNSENMR